MFFADSGISVARVGIIVMLVVEWLQRDKEHGLQDADRVVRNRWLRYLLFAALFVATYFFRGAYTEFIYFQF